MAESEETHSLVINNGTYAMQSGSAGDDAPRVFRTLIANSSDDDSKDIRIGDELSTATSCNVRMPMSKGRIVDWEAMEQIWRHTLQAMRVFPEEQAALLTECCLNPKENRERMTTVWFEKFNVPSFFVQQCAVLSLYASGRTTGVTVDCGYENVTTVPMYEGYALPHATLKSNYGGQHCSEYLKTLLARTQKISDKVGTSVMDDIKHKMAKVGATSTDYELEISKKYCDPQHIVSGFLREIDEAYYGHFSSVDVEQMCMKYSQHFIKDMKFLDTLQMFALPDGRLLKIGSEPVQCTEVLFDPKLLGIDEPGIHTQCQASCQKCQVDIRRYTWNNIVLSGGTSMIPDLEVRMQHELASLASQHVKVNVICPGERKYSAWVGGSILASLSTFQDMWITKHEYEEGGSAVVHRKCF